MKTINKIILLGYIGDDPRPNPNSRVPVTTFSLATNYKHQDIDKTVWHNCVAFNKTAENAALYIRKGDKVYVDGNIDYSTYDKDGVTMHSTKIIVQNFSVVHSKIEKPKAPEPVAQSYYNVNHFPEKNLDDDVPF